MSGTYSRLSWKQSLLSCLTCRQHLVPCLGLWNGILRFADDEPAAVKAGGTGREQPVLLRR